MKAFYFFATLIFVLSVAAYLRYRQEEPPPPPAPVAMSPEEKQFVREAHQLGTRLYSMGRRVQQTSANVEEQQQKLKPVYEQMEQFIFKRLSAYTNLISTVIVVYYEPDLQCTIYVKPGSEQQLSQMKRAADGCVGRIIENYPMVKYLMVKRETGI